MLVMNLDLLRIVMKLISQSFQTTFPSPRFFSFINLAEGFAFWSFSYQSCEEVLPALTTWMAFLETVFNFFYVRDVTHNRIYAHLSCHVVVDQRLLFKSDLHLSVYEPFFHFSHSFLHRTLRVISLPDQVDFILDLWDQSLSFLLWFCNRSLDFDLWNFHELTFFNFAWPKRRTTLMKSRINLRQRVKRLYLELCSFDKSFVFKNLLIVASQCLNLFYIDVLSFQ